MVMKAELNGESRCPEGIIVFCEMVRRGSRARNCRLTRCNACWAWGIMTKVIGEDDETPGVLYVPDRGENQGLVES